MHRIVIALLLTGCCITPSTTNPGAPGAAPAVGAAPALTGPGGPGCLDVATALVGTWAREGLVEEYRADGTYAINGVTGTYRFTAPGRAALDEATTGRHAEFDIGIADATTMISIGEGNVGVVYARTSPPPAAAASCYDLSTAFARTWIPRIGGPPEVYAADGTYTVSGSGRWSFTAPGRLLLVRTGDGVTSDYVVAMPTPTTMMAVRAGSGVFYDAAP